VLFWGSNAQRYLLYKVFCTTWSGRFRKKNLTKVISCAPHAHDSGELEFEHRNNRFCKNWEYECQCALHGSQTAAVRRPCGAIGRKLGFGATSTILGQSTGTVYQSVISQSIPVGDSDGSVTLGAIQQRPTLSLLVESRKPSKSSFEKPSILLVANPDGSLQEAWPEIWSVQRLNTVTRVTTLRLLGRRSKSASVVLEA